MSEREQIIIRVMHIDICDHTHTHTRLHMAFIHNLILRFDKRRLILEHCWFSSSGRYILFDIICA